jgi:hypothetical protein
VRSMELSVPTWCWGCFDRDLALELRRTDTWMTSRTKPHRGSGHPGLINLAPPLGKTSTLAA